MSICAWSIPAFAIRAAISAASRRRKRSSISANSLRANISSSSDSSHRDATLHRRAGILGGRWLAEQGSQRHACLGFPVVLAYGLRRHWQVSRALAHA
jgi:hypothetical protein